MRSGAGSDYPGLGEPEPARASRQTVGLFLVRLLVASPLLALAIAVVFLTQGELVGMVVGGVLVGAYGAMWAREQLAGQTAATAGLALQMIATVLALTTVTTAVVARRDEFITGTLWLVLLAIMIAGLAAGLRLLWARRQPVRFQPGWVVLATLGLVAVVVLFLPRDSEASTGERILARDLAPEGGYVAMVAVALSLLVGLPLTFRWRLQNLGSSKGEWRKAVVAAGLTTVLVVPALVVAGGGWARRLHDWRIESDLTSHPVEQPVERLDRTAGPLRPSDQVWQKALPLADEGGDALDPSVSVEAVPGWDTVLIAERIPSGAEDTERVVALSMADGSEQWRYERREVTEGLDGVVVDPEAGRVLLVMQQAAVVLRLEDGSIAEERAIPGDVSCGSVLDQSIPNSFDDTTPLGTGAVAVARCDPPTEERRSLVAIETSTGQVMETAVLPQEPETDQCHYATAGGGQDTTPLVVRWGSGDTCGQPTVFGFGRSGGAGGSGSLEPVTTISSPDHMACMVYCEDTSVAVVGDSIVLSLVCDTTDDEEGRVPKQDVVVVSADGDLLWRARDRAAASDGAVPQDLAMGMPTSDGILVRWAGAWHLLSTADGSELAHHPADAGDDAASCGPIVDAVADDQRTYMLCDRGQLVVRSLEDLGAGPSVDLYPQPLPERPGRPELLTVAGPLVVASPANPDEPTEGIASLSAYDDVSSG